jgi:hypothetical protein
MCSCLLLRRRAGRREAGQVVLVEGVVEGLHGAWPGEARGPKRLNEVLTELFALRGLARRRRRRAVEDAWLSVLPAEFAGRAQVGRYQRGVLEVLVSDAVALQELAGFHQETLLERLRQRLGPGLREVRFRPA